MAATQAQSGSWMKAGLRFGTILLAGGLWFAPVSVLAQNAPTQNKLAQNTLAQNTLAQNTAQPATTNSPASDAVGPRELQNFSLPGTTTRPADQAPSAPIPNTPASDAAEP